MDKKMGDFVLDIMDHQKDLTLATLRQDGFPQANTVSYANDGLTIYFCTGGNTQKVKNIQKCNKVSLTIDRPYGDWSKIKGLSMGATAETLTNPEEIERAMGLLIEKFPAIKEMKPPDPEEPVVVVKITPKIISALNYELGFGHTDLVEV